MIRNAPEIWNGTDWEERRGQIINLLCEEEYGFLPPVPENLTWETVEVEKDFCAGKAPLKKVTLHITLAGGGSFDLPVRTVIPAGENIPFFVYISFSSMTPDKFFPCEEIADGGFGSLSFCYEDVTKDNGDFKDGLAGVLDLEDNARCGKIALWAWAASRVMDYALSLPELDQSRAAIAGHSRLGKTALLAGAVDARFTHVFSNNSGCGGAALSREKKGETIRAITDVFPYWFKAGFKRYADNETAMPFDQHFLLAATAPRKVYVSSADGDLWADPESEFLSCVLAGEVWTKLGLKGFVCGGYPETGGTYNEGHVAYHLRGGAHYLGRDDWRHFMRYMNL
jgi:hypothetical protein